MKRMLLICASIIRIVIAYGGNTSVDSLTHEIRGVNVGNNFVIKKNDTISFCAYGLSPRLLFHFYLDGKKMSHDKYTYYTIKGYPSYKYYEQYDILASRISEGSHTWTLNDGNGGILHGSGSFTMTYQTLDGSSCSHQPKNIHIESFSPKRWEKSVNNGVSWSNIACTSTSYTDSNPSVGKVMYRALNRDNTYSDVVTITYVDAVPSTIQALPSTSTKTAEESITLTADVVDNDYSYQWKKGGADIPNATSRTYTISSIKSSDAGDYTCYVSNGCNGATTTTATLSVNKCAQTINFPEIPTLTYETGFTYTLPQTTDKGLTITYQSMNTSVATVNGNVLTIKAPGTAIISASQVGNDDYLEATPVSRTLTVNKRTQTITFDELPEKTYEDLPFALPQTTDEGLTISYTSTNTAVAGVSGNTVTILKPGTTDIIASQAGDATHYAAAEVSQTLVVKKAAQEITFGALSNKVYGDAPFELNKVSNKNLTITYTSSDADIASIAENVVTVNKPGTVTITASQAGNAYYLAAESVSQTLTIVKGNQTINFPTLESRAFDSGDFELPAQTDKGLTIVYESNNEDVATMENNIVHLVGAGTANITASQAGNEYYNVAQSVTQSLTITKAYQTITFPELQTYIYGQESDTLRATVNSGLPIEFESSDYSVATVDGNILTIVGAGQCYITASAAGNKNYYSANPVERTLIVNKAQPVIDFTPIVGEFTYGDNPIALSATCSVGEATFSSSNPAKLFIAGTNAVIMGAGTFTITASLEESANYAAASTTQEITINKANLMVTADNVSREYGEQNPAFTYTFNGFVNGDTQTELSSTIEVSSVADPLSAVGNYEIVMSATEDYNYNIVCRKGVLTITKAPLFISVEQKTREYGDDNPEFTCLYIGWKNNEDTTALTTLPQAYTTAKKSSPVGRYPIFTGGAAASNYSISYANDTLEILKAPLTIRALDITRKRGEENPTFELQIDSFKLGETTANLEKLPTIQCEADEDSPVGTYPIVLLEDGYATNYRYILINGVLTVENLQYTVIAISQIDSMGTVGGGGIYDEGETVTLIANPHYGYRFSKWSDENIDNPREFVLTQDTTFEALFIVAAIQDSCINESYLPIEGSGLGEMTTDNTSVWTYSSQYGAYGKKQGGGVGHLFTPTLDMGEVAQVTISFQHTHKFAVNALTELTLWVTPNYNGSWDNSKWYQLTISPYATNTDWNFVNASINVPIAFVGANTVFAFQYQSTSSNYSTWEIKNLQIIADCYKQDSEGMENILFDDVTPHKIIINGQIYILRGDKVYTIQGQEVR